MLIPLGHDHSVRRWPWITSLIILLNIAAFVVTNGAINRESEEQGARLEQAVAFLIAHPYLEAPPELTDQLPRRLREELADSARASRQLMEEQGARLENANRADLERAGLTGLVDPAVRESEQSELGRRTDEIVTAARLSTLGRYGHVPAFGSFVGLIGHQFLHGGIAHLVFNMWFLWL